MRPQFIIRYAARHPIWAIAIIAIPILILLLPVSKICYFIEGEYYDVFRPDFDELIIEGNMIVDEVKKFRNIHGRFPDVMPQIQGYKLTNKYGGWQYQNRENHFRLQIGDYGRFCWEVKFSSNAHGDSGDGEGWYVDT